jgi:hypothetical protein
MMAAGFPLGGGPPIASGDDLEVVGAVGLILVGLTAALVLWAVLHCWRRL